MSKNLEQNGYIVIKNFLPKDFCRFIQVYFKVRQDTLDYEIDAQNSRSKVFYADPLIETVLLTSCKTLSEITKIDLIPQYSQTFVYGKGDVVNIDQNQLEYDFSTIVCLGNPSQETNNSFYLSKQNHENTDNEIFLEEGDLCLYKTSELYLWNKPFNQSWSLQAFMHFTNKNGPNGNKIFDGRRTLGIKK